MLRVAGIFYILWGEPGLAVTLLVISLLCSVLVRIGPIVDSTEER